MPNAPKGWPKAPPVSESRTPCPRCGRPPRGEPGYLTGHRDACPRSRASKRALADALGELGAPRSTYPGKGRFAVRDPRGRVRWGVNPGVPLVRDPKPRTAGGLPSGTMRLVVARHPDGSVREWSPRLDRAKLAAKFLKDWGVVGRRVRLAGIA